MVAVDRLGDSWLLTVVFTKAAGTLFHVGAATQLIVSNLSPLGGTGYASS